MVKNWNRYFEGYWMLSNESLAAILLPHSNTLCSFEISFNSKRIKFSDYSLFFQWTWRIWQLWILISFLILKCYFVMKSIEIHCICQKFHRIIVKKLTWNMKCKMFCKKHQMNKLLFLSIKFSNTFKKCTFIYLSIV